MLASVLMDDSGSGSSQPKSVVSNPMYKELEEATVASLITGDQLISKSDQSGGDASNTSEVDELLHNARRFAATNNLHAAKSLTQRAVDSLSEKGGGWKPEVAAVCTELSWILNGLGEIEEARENAQRATSIWERCKPPQTETEEYRAAIAQQLHSAVYLRDEDAVLKNCRKGRQILKAYGWDGAQGPGMCTLVNEMAEAYRFLRNLGEATKMSAAALNLSRRLYGDAHINTATAMVRVASIAVCKMEVERARSDSDLSAEKLAEDAARQLNDIMPLSSEAISIFKRYFGPIHPTTIMHKARHARLMSMQGSYSAAHALFEEAISLIEASTLNNSDTHAHALANQAQNLLMMGQLEPSVVVAAKAKTVMKLLPTQFPGDIPEQYMTNFERHWHKLQPKRTKKKMNAVMEKYIN